MPFLVYWNESTLRRTIRNVKPKTAFEFGIMIWISGKCCGHARFILASSSLQMAIPWQTQTRAVIRHSKFHSFVVFRWVSLYGRPRFHDEYIQSNDMPFFHGLFAWCGDYFGGVAECLAGVRRISQNRDGRDSRRFEIQHHRVSGECR